MTDAAPLTLVTSHDGQWAVARQDRKLVLMPGAGGAPVASVELSSADVDIALVGPPTALIVLSRDPDARGIVLYTTPYLEAAARIDLDIDARLAAASGPRVAVASADNKNVAVVRSAGRALATQKLDLTPPIEFIVGLERNQMLFGLSKKLEVWDAVSGRPMLRAQFQLPPPPRVLGASAGHLWARQIGSDEIFLYRLSDGRPFRHDAGAPISDVICHPASPLLVLVTPKGLLRLHGYAHSLTPLDDVPDNHGALALHVSGEDITLLGFTGVGADMWRLPISGSSTGAIAVQTATPSAVPVASETARPSTPATASRWREPLATYGAELARGSEAELPIVAIDNELGDLAHRLELSATARRVLTALYALHLIGESISIAALAKATGDWTEALGQGELGALAMLRRKHGKIGLRTAVRDFLDGAAPRSIRIVGTGATTPRTGAFRVSRDSRTDAEIETALAGELGRIAVVDGSLRSALLEARLHGATAIAYSVPAERPRPWPRDAGLVLVLYGTNASWVADLPTLGATAS
ncbi:MAG TPA: hypothetical protein VFV99_14845 [Kofleriaceae bacterium]|nr:hypothetical protein [Kofleriaceae bacterium]